MHFGLILDLGVLKCDLFRLDFLHDLVILLQSDDPFAKTFGSVRCLGNSRRLELRVLEECALNLVHDKGIDVVLLIVLKC